MKREEPLWQTPETFTGLKIGPPETVAAGLPGVIATTRKTLQEPGLMRGLRVLARVNQKSGFDCSSCAWPDPEDHRSVAEFCENGAKAVADEATTRRINAEFFATHSLRQLSERSDYWLNLQGRLTEPLYLAPESNHYQPISWENAFHKVGTTLNSLSTPHQAAFYTSGRTSNEAAFLYQLFVRMYGTNNMPDCSNLCHDSSGVGLSETVGIGKGSVILEDLHQADMILILGQNPGTNHPRMLSALQKARAQGARIISINPLPEAGLTRFKNPQDFMSPWRALPTLLGDGTEMAHQWLPVRLNGDVALLKGFCKALWELDQDRPGRAIDWAFLRAKTAGFEEFRVDLEGESWDRIVAESGIARPVIQDIAGQLARTSKIVVCWAMGLTQHKNAVANVQEVVNLILMRGSIGKPGAGLCPVRGHSNVQGDRTMGITAWPKPCFLEALTREFNFTPPTQRGLDTVATIRAMAAEEVKVLVALGGNFLSATPDTEFTAGALSRCLLTVQISTKLNRSHLITGREALILPCLGRSEIDRQATGEQFVTVENSMGKVHSSRGVLPPASPHLRSEIAIVAGMAAATIGNTTPWEALKDDYSLIRQSIERCIVGFENYNERAAEGFYLPNGPRVGRFPTPSGKAHFTVHTIPEWRLHPGELLMMTIRSHDQFNTTVYGLDDRYRGISQERRVILLNPKDIESQGLKSGQVVDLTCDSHGQVRQVRRFIVLPYPITEGCCATYFPETNPLIPLDSVAEKSNTPTSKSIVIRLCPSQT